MNIKHENFDGLKKNIFTITNFNTIIESPV